jgi:hypothetical protein
MALKTIIETKSDLDALPEPVRQFYAEKDGKYILETDQDVSGLRSALDKERTTAQNLDKEIKKLKSQVEKYNGVDPDKAREALQKISQLEEKQLIDAGKIDEVVEQRVAAMKTDYEGKISAYDRSLKEKEQEAQNLNAQLSTLLIDGAITEAAIAAGVKKSAIPDVILRGRQIYKLQDGKPVPMHGDEIIYGKNPREPMPIAEWVGTLAKDADHLFEGSGGGGAQNKTNQNTNSGSTVTISREQARDPQAYKAARDAAEKAGKQLVVQQ